MYETLKNRPIFSSLAGKILICFLLLMQLFPPLWVQDVTSLRHFFIALFDIAAGCVVAYGIFRFKKTNKGNAPLICNPMRFKPMIVFALLLIYMAISISWAINKVEGIAVLNRWILVFLSAMFTGIFLVDNKRLFHVMVYCTMIITLVNVLTCIIGYYYFDLHISQRRNLMLNGGYGNKNIFAVCLLFKLPLLFYAILRYKRIWKITASLLVGAVCFCLVILSTRSTFIGLFMQIIVLIAYALIQKIRFKARNTYVIYICVIIGCCLIGFFFGNKFIEYNYNRYASHNVQNNYTVAARVKTIEEGNSKGRLIIWRNTLEIIKMNPWIGYGVGNHKLNIMRVEAKKKTNYVVSDHAHNDFLEMQSELGVIGELLYILLYLTMAIVGIKIIINKNTKEPYRLMALCSLLLLMTYANDAMFNFPNERATPQMYLGVSIAMMMSAFNKTIGKTSTAKPKTAITVGLGVLILWTFYVETNHFVSSIVQRQRILCHNNHNKNHIAPQHWVNIAPWLPNIDESTKPIALNNAMMYALEGDYRTAINIMINDNANPYYALKEYRLASYYAHMGMIDSSNYWADSCIKAKPLCYDPVRVKVGNAKLKKDDALAEKIIREYLQKEKSDERAWIDLINIYLNRSDYQSAAKVYEQGVKNNITKRSFIAKKAEIEAIERLDSTYFSPMQTNE